jgi:hypothetical protein
MDALAAQGVEEQTQHAASSRERSPWRAAIIWSVGAWACSRVGLVLVSYFGQVLNLQHGGIGAASTLTPLQVNPARLIESWQQWDANWYVRIATEGYSMPASAAFYPLFPALIHALHWLVPVLPPVVCGMIIANASLLGALVLLVRLAQHDLHLDAGQKAGWLLLAYPGAFYLAAAYTESLLLALMLGALLAIRTRRLPLAVGLAVCASVSAVGGVLIGIPIAWEIFRSSAGWKQLGLRLATLIPIPLAIFGFALYLGRRLGDPTLLLHAHQLYWLHTLSPIRGLPLALYRLIQFPANGYVVARNLVDVLPVLLAIAALVYAARALPVCYVLLGAAMLLLFLIEPLRSLFPLASDVRRLLTIFPLFLAGGVWLARHPAWQAPLLFLFLPLQAILLLLFLQHAYLP